MNDVPIKIRRQNRKSMMMRRTLEGVEVFIPHWMKKDSRIVRQFIAGGLKKLDKLPPPLEHEELVSPAEIRALARQWAGCMGLDPKRITLRTMSRKWGSCSSRDNITFNSALRYLPRHLVEYVIVHELVHLLIFNHGSEFRQMMTGFLPGWEEAERELNRIRL